MREQLVSPAVMTVDDEAPSVPCSACRGTGKVISRLGGTAQEVVCPWCEGGGRRLGSEHDAQRVGRGAGDGGSAGGGDHDGDPPDQAA